MIILWLLEKFGNNEIIDFGVVNRAPCSWPTLPSKPKRSNSENQYFAES